MNTNDMINSMPSMARQPKQPLAADQATMVVNQAIPYILQFIANEIPIKKELAASNALQQKLVELTEGLQTLIEANDTPKFTKDVTDALSDMAEKVNNPIINVTVATDAIKAVEKAVKAIAPTKSVDVNNLDEVTKAINELKPILLKLSSSIEESKVEVSEDVNLDKESKGYLKNLVTDAKNPIAVRLSDGKEFYKAVGQVSDSIRAMTGSSGNNFLTTTGNPTKANLDADGNLKVTVSGGISGGGNGYINDGVDTSIKATVTDLANSNPLAVSIVDGSGTQITSFGGGTQYADGAVRGTATGTLAMGDDGTNIQSVKVDSNGVLAIQDNSGSITVDAVSLPLPTGASTAAKQPALGTAGTASTDVLTVQGIDSMTALKVDGSAVTQPVSGIVTAQQSTATNLKAQAENYQGGTAVGAGNPLQVTLANTGSNATAVKVDGSAVTQPVSGTVSITANSSVNVAQVNGVTTATGSGIMGTGVQRVAIASDNDAVTVKQATGTNLHVVTDSGTITTVSTVTNLSQMSGTAISMNTGVRDAGTQRVTIATNDAVPVTFTGSTDVATQTTLASLLTSSQLIDDTVFTDDTSTHSTGSTKGLGVMAVAAPTDTAVNANDIGMIAMTVNREQYTSLRDISGTAAVSGSGTSTGALRVELPTNGTGVIATVTTVSTVSALGVGNTGPQKAEDVASAGGDMGIAVMMPRLDTPVANAGVSNDGDYTTPVLDNFRKQWVTGTAPEDTAHVAGEAITINGTRRIDTAATSAGTSGDWATMDSSAEGAVWSTLTPTTTSGLSVANFTSGDTYTALTNTAQVIKASAGNLYGYYIYNPNATATYVMVYNIAAASVTVGTSTALLVFCIPATSGANLMFPYPITFSNAGWSAAAATTGGGNTAPTTALECMFWYK